MRKALIGLGVGMALTQSGCTWWKHFHERDRAPLTATAQETPTVSSLVAYVNDNSRRVGALRSTQVAIDCKQDRQMVGLDGMLMFQKPRSFRLKAKLLGQPGVDIGSNDQEFWYWISKAEPVPYVFHCSYDELKKGGVWLPFPFQPDMIIAALGVAEFDEDPSKYELKTQPRHLELIQKTVSAQGQPVQRVTIFNRYQVAPGKPQVVAHVLRDMEGKDICNVTVFEVQTDRDTGAVLPYKVKLSWPQEKVEMTMRMHDLHSTQIDQPTAGRAFSRLDLSQLPSFDLARGAPDQPVGVSSGEPLQRVGGFQPRR